MKNIIKNHLLAAFISLLAALATWQIFQVIDRLMDQNHLAHQQLETGNRLSEFRLQLEQYLNTTFYLTQSFSTLVDLGMMHEPDLKKLWSVNFQLWAEKNHRQLPFIRNIGLTSGFIITHVYPLEGNQAVIGVDYRDVPEQWPTVEHTADNTGPVLAGPLELLQGGTGLVFRTPFFRPENNGQETFTGLALIVLDLPDLLHSAGLHTLSNDLTIAIYDTGNQFEEASVFFGPADLFDNEKSIIQSVDFLGGQWKLAGEPAQGWLSGSPHRQLLSILSVMMILFVAAATYMAARSIQQQRYQALQLAEKVTKRTRLLQKAKQQAEQANQAKSAFFASITHDLRTPLNSIIGLNQLLMDMQPSDKQREYLRKSQASANLLLLLVNDILGYAKMEFGKESLNIRAFHLGELLQTLDDLFSTSAESKNIHLTFEYDADMPLAWHGDPDKLLQILANLCANALKFTQEGEIRVEVTQIENAEKPALCFTVADTGVGIESSDIPHLFEPFAQFNNKNPASFDGTGLGLNICKKLTDMMGGTIEVESEPGKGSHFTVCMPLAIADGSEVPLTKNTRVPLPDNLAGTTLVLAEDNPLNQLVTTRLLEKAHITVLLAENGEQVLQILREHAVDGILMDMQMPILDGLATTQKIRQRMQYHDLPIIALTANASDEDRQRAMAAGMNDFVGKPIDAAVLYRSLQAWIK